MIDETPRRPLHVVSWPDWSGANPYQRLFYDALAAHGVQVVDFPRLLPHRLTNHRPPIDFLHFHWPYPFWRDRGTALLRQGIAVARLRLLLTKLKRAGISVIWTVHDLEHLSGDRLPDRIGNRLLYRSADLLIHHTQWSRNAGDARFGAPGGDVLVMPHGNYRGAYPAPAPAPATRARMGIPEGKRVLLCFGQLREAKGFDLAMKALATLPSDSYHLVVAGKPHDAADGLKGQAGERGNVTLIAEEVPAQTAANLFEAADAVVLPYRRSTNSGVLVAALSMSRGVITTALPAMQELMARNPEAGVLVPPEDPTALAGGIREFFQTPTERRSDAASDLADQLEWASLVPPVAAWMRRAVGGGRGNPSPS